MHENNIINQYIRSLEWEIPISQKQQIIWPANIFSDVMLCYAML